MEPSDPADGGTLHRLSAADLMMLRPDEVGWRQDIGALGLLDGGPLLDDGGRLRLDAVHRLVVGRLHLVPRFRQVLCTPPVGLGGPLWVDAPRFDVGDHVRVAPLPPGSGDDELLREVERLRRRPFDRRRPLWELWLCPGLADGRVGLYVKLHHAVADGVAGVALLGAFLDAVPGGAATDPAPWTPDPLPTRGELLADNVGRKLAAARRSLGSLTDPIGTVRGWRRRWRDLRDAFGLPPAPATSVNRPIGETRRMVLVRADLDALKAAGHAHAATVNDVLVSAVAGGYRELLRSRGEDVEGLVLRASVPVSFHDQDPTGSRANSDGMMFVPLPVGVADPVDRLERIAPATVELKRHVHRPPSGPIVSSRLAQHLLWRQFDHQRWSNAYVANVPGPADALYFAGARLEAVFPVVPIMGNLTVGVGAMSYAGQFGITVVADVASCPDVEVFADGLRRALDELTAGIPTGQTGTSGGGNHVASTTSGAPS